MVTKKRRVKSHYKIVEAPKHIKKTGYRYRLIRVPQKKGKKVDLLMKTKKEAKRWLRWTKEW